MVGEHLIPPRNNSKTVGVSVPSPAFPVNSEVVHSLAYIPPSILWIKCVLGLLRASIAALQLFVGRGEVILNPKPPIIDEFRSPINPPWAFSL